MSQTSFYALRRANRARRRAERLNEKANAVAIALSPLVLGLVAFLAFLK